MRQLALSDQVGGNETVIQRTTACVNTVDGTADLKAVILTQKEKASPARAGYRSTISARR